MIGRQAELETLIRALERARDGNGSVALVGGEAGIGKTTLVGELRSAAESRSVDVLWGRTPEAAWAAPYAPWIEALGSGAADLFDAPLSLSPQDRQIQIHDRVLHHLDRPKSSLLVLEDLHWAQPATLDLLRHIAFGAALFPLSIVGTYRASAAAPHLPLGRALGQLRQETNAIDLTLTGLDREQMRLLLGRYVDAQLDRILVETGGNPLFAIELGRTLSEGPPPVAPTSELAVPLTLRQAIGQRLERLPPAAQQVLSTAAIFEDAFQLDTVADLLNLPENDVIQAIDDATVAGLVRAGRGLDEFEFAHAVVRQAVLSNWQPSRLIRERRRIADVLAAMPRVDRPGEVASLYHASRNLPGAEAGVPFALDAAEDCRTDASHLRTATFLQIAFDLSLPDDPRREEMLRGLALAQAESLQIEPALETAWRAIDEMDRSGADADVIADFSAAIAVALKHRAGATIEQWSPFVTFGLQRVQGARGLGWARLSFVQEPVEPVSRSGIRAGIWTGFDTEAIAIARTKGTEEDQARSFESFDSRTRDETDALIALARGFRNPYARLHAFTVAANDLQYRHDAYRDALRIWNEIDTLAERNGVVGWQAQARNQRALIEIAQGNFELAAVTEDEANSLLVRLGPGRRPELFAMEMATARACYLGGDFGSLADSWIALADDPSLGPAESASLLGPYFAAVGAFAATEAGQAKKAQAILAILTPLLARMPLDAPNHNGSVAFAALSVWNLRDAQAAPAFRHLLGRMIEMGMQDYPQSSLALSLARMNALLDRTDEAESAFALARHQLDTSGQAPLRAIADLEQAAWLSERSRPDFERAARLATEAYERFEQLRMPFWRERATTLMDTIAHKAGPAIYPAGLTDREVEVLALAVQGHSDKEISDLLFISPRTVNAHMRNMFAKTGSSNRTELSVWAVAQGLVTR
jgi:DNA-binding CsgD family transcriptional regulator